MMLSTQQQPCPQETSPPDSSHCWAPWCLDHSVFYIGSDWCSCHGSVTGRHSGDRWGGVTSKVQLKPESRRYCGPRSRRRNGRESTEGGAGQDSSTPLQVPEAAHTGPFPHMGNVGVSLQHILCDHVVAEESLHTGVVPGNVLCLTQIRKSSA